MKKRIILAFAAIMVMGLAVAAFAFTSTRGSSASAMSCSCCSGDSCPMKKKDAAGKETTSCCDNCDCCGDSCPMKAKGEKTATTPDSPDMKNVTVTSSTKRCDGSCCHKKKDKKDSPAV